MSIPSFWKITRLEKVVLDTQPGFAQRPNQGKIGVPQLRTNNVSSNGSLNLSEKKYVNADDGVIEKYGVHKGDIIFNNTNSPDLVGKTALFDLDDLYVISNHMTRIRIDPELADAEYLAKYLHYLWQMGESKSWAKQWVNQASIDQSSLRKFDIPLPPLPEQRRIAAILRQADALRQWRREANEKSKTLTNAIFDYKFSEFSKFQWQPLSEVCEYITKGTTPSGMDISDFKKEDSDVPFIKVYHISDDGNIDFEANPSYVNQKLHSRQLNRSKVLPNDVLMNIVGPPLGKIGIVPDDYIEWNTNQAIAIFRCKKVLEPLYLFHALRSLKILPSILRLAVGVRQLNISLAQCRAIEIPVPDIQTQKDFVSKISETRHIRKNQQSSFAILEEMQKSLYSRAFTGELTAPWREGREDELRRAAEIRDSALRERNQKTNQIQINVEGNLNLQPDLEGLRQAVGNFGVYLAKNVLDGYQDNLSRTLQEFGNIAAGITQNLLPTTYIESLRESLKAMLASIQLSALPSMDPEAFWNYVDSRPIPHENRAVVAALDPITLRVLKLAGTYPAYFLAEDLETGQLAGGISTPQAESSLRVLRALGFVKLIQIDGFLRYRLVDENDYASQSASL